MSEQERNYSKLDSIQNQLNQVERAATLAKETVEKRALNIFPPDEINPTTPTTLETIQNFHKLGFQRKSFVEQTTTVVIPRLNELRDHLTNQLQQQQTVELYREVATLMEEGYFSSSEEEKLHEHIQTTLIRGTNGRSKEPLPHSTIINHESPLSSPTNKNLQVQNPEASNETQMTSENNQQETIPLRFFRALLQEHHKNRSSGMDKLSELVFESEIRAGTMSKEEAKNRIKRGYTAKIRRAVQLHGGDLINKGTPGNSLFDLVLPNDPEAVINIESALLDTRKVKKETSEKNNPPYVNHESIAPSSSHSERISQLNHATSSIKTDTQEGAHRIQTIMSGLPLAPRHINIYQFVGHSPDKSIPRDEWASMAFPDSPSQQAKTKLGIYLAESEPLLRKAGIEVIRVKDGKKPVAYYLKETSSSSADEVKKINSPDPQNQNEIELNTALHEPVIDHEKYASHHRTESPPFEPIYLQAGALKVLKSLIGTAEHSPKHTNELIMGPKEGGRPKKKDTTTFRTNLATLRFALNNTPVSIKNVILEDGNPDPNRFYLDVPPGTKLEDYINLNGNKRESFTTTLEPGIPSDIKSGPTGNSGEQEYSEILSNEEREVTEITLHPTLFRCEMNGRTFQLTFGKEIQLLETLSSLQRQALSARELAGPHATQRDIAYIKQNFERFQKMFEKDPDNPQIFVTSGTEQNPLYEFRGNIKIAKNVQ